MNWILLTQTGDNLFSSEWTQGNLYAIQGLVSKLGSFACWVISIVGFGIVIFSILKNAMSGLYVVNPRFWDKVDEVKMAAVGTVQGEVQTFVGQSGNVHAQQLGTLLTTLLNYIPNIRALTDFEDGADVDKRQYFIHSIPLLVAQIFIGMFIFYGYPARVAQWIGTGGTTLVSAVLNNVDPSTVVTNTMDSFVNYNLMTDHSTDPLEQAVNKMVTQAVPVIHSSYPDMKKAPTQDVAYSIENTLLSVFSDGTSQKVLGAYEGYNVQSTVTFTKLIPSVSGAYASEPGCNYFSAIASNGTVGFKYWIQCSELPTGVPNVGEQDYIIFTVTATPTALTTVSTSKAIAFAGYGTGVNTNGSWSIPINAVSIGNGETDLNGTPGAVVVDVVSIADGTILSSVNASLEKSTMMQTTNCACYLVINETVWDTLVKNTLAGKGPDEYYLRINLNNWKMSVKTQSGAGYSKNTLGVSEMRLLSGVSDLKFGLTTWTDISMKDGKAPTGCASGTSAFTDGKWVNKTAANMDTTE